MEYTATYNTDIGIRKSTNQDSVAIRIVDTQLVAVFLDESPPPCLRHIVHVGIVARFLIIPHLVGGGADKAFEGGITIAQDRHRLLDLSRHTQGNNGQNNA